MPIFGEDISTIHNGKTNEFFLKKSTDIESIFKNQKKPIVISGPCSAESEEQLMKTAKELCENQNISVFRAGIWKPRTRPNVFEGRGVIALPWLQRVREVYNIPVATEVANAKHVEAALKHNIDILWIGARTTVNPFSVQEIANALKGVGTPVMIKNPMHVDLGLWIGAIERIYQAGSKKIAAIHRGFNAHGNSPYRNNPKWEIPIELQRQFPYLDIICDPSHISGNRQLIKSVSQFAMDLNFRGLMIESHVDPESALSDSQQQITPRALQQILNELTICKSGLENKELENLKKLRYSIDDVDTQIIDMLCERMQITEQIGKIKREKGLPIFQIERWDEVINSRTSVGAQKGLSSNFLREILELIHKESIRIQSEK